jgi:hypothetical protein
MGNIGKVIAMAGACAVAISVIPTTSVQAVKGETWTAPLDGQDYLWGIDPVITSFGTTNTDTATWSSQGDGWSYLLGTDIKVKSEGDTLTIQGSGELPDYNIFTTYLRPWANSTCSRLVIDDAITYIGSYSFYGMENLKYVYIGSKTFVNDSTCFEGVSDNLEITIGGDETTSKQFGKITLTSLDSIKRLKGDTIEAQVVSPNLPDNYDITAKRKFQSNECYEAYAAFIGDYNFLTTFDITLTDNGSMIGTTPNKFLYTLDLPTEFIEEGRDFKLLAIGSGYVYTYDDLDDNDATFTFETDTPTTWYALVYK